MNTHPIVDPCPSLGELRWPNNLRPGLPPLPPRIARLPRHRGYPVPWFVAWVGGEPEFRAADARKHSLAIDEGRCWVCGSQIGRGVMAFVIGPMCAITRITVEPACHIDCAEWSALACPFLARPHMERREGGMPEGIRDPAGEMIRRNPGVTLIWIAKRFTTIEDPDPRRGCLIRVGQPTKVTAYASGRRATREELAESVRTGLPLLRAQAEKDGQVAITELKRMTEKALRLLGLPKAVAS
jgi:hypothetical protein